MDKGIRTESSSNTNLDWKQERNKSSSDTENRSTT